MHVCLNKVKFKLLIFSILCSWHSVCLSDKESDKSFTLTRMFRNYLITAYRNLFRHLGFSFINIAGLALGLTACLLIGLFVHDELQYDKFLPEG